VALKFFCTDDGKLYSERTVKISLSDIGATPPLGRLRHNKSITPGEKYLIIRFVLVCEYLRTRYYDMS